MSSDEGKRRERARKEDRDRVERRVVVDAVDENATVYKSLVVVPSEARFLEYQKTNPERLRAEKIDETNYLRKPNGEGENEGFWVYPFPKDVWDINVNRDMTVTDHVEIFTELDFRYISNPSKPVYGNYRDSDNVYPIKYARLWDFLYNQDHYLDPSLTRERSKPFPIDSPSSEPIVPDILADSTMPEELSYRYPYAAWETAVYPVGKSTGDVDRVTRRRARKFSYVRAHGEHTPPESLDAFNFEPHDVTNTVPPLFRVFKSSSERESSLSYNPIVLRGVDEYSTNGWISFYRQAVQITKNLQFAASGEIWDKFIASKNASEDRGNPRSLPEAVFFALDKERMTVWNNGTEFPDVSSEGFSVFVMPIETNPTTGKIVKPSAAKTKALSTLNLVLDLLRRNEGSGNIRELVYDNDRPRFYTQPYRVVTIQVVTPSSLVPKMRVRRNAIFNHLKPWVLSVPPQLSVRSVGEINNFEEETTTWYTKDEQVRIERVPGTVHQATVDFLDFGRKTVYASTPSRNLFFEFLLEAAVLNIEYIEFPLLRDHGRRRGRARLYRLPPGLWTGVRFTNREMVNFARNDSALQYKISNEWDKVENRDPSFFVHFVEVAGVTHTPYFYGHRQFLWATNQYESNTFYLFIFSAQTENVYVNTFGDSAVLLISDSLTREGGDNGYDDKTGLDSDSSSVKSIKWTNSSGKVRDTDNDKSVMEFEVVLPRQLGKYVAELTLVDKGKEGSFRVAFDVELRWPYVVTQDYMHKRGIPEFNFTTSSWPLVYGERVDTYNSVSILPILGDMGRLTHYQTLRSSEEDETPFFKAAIRSFAKWYGTDVQNYARVFPWLVSYCELAQRVVESSDGRVGIADETIPNDVAQLLPSHLNPPLLMMKLDALDTTVYNGALALYIVFDPVEEVWVNALSFSTERTSPLPKHWTVDIAKGLRKALKESYLRCSPAYVEGQFVDERTRIVEEVSGGSSATLAQLYERDRSRYLELERVAALKSDFIRDDQERLVQSIQSAYEHLESSLYIEVSWKRAIEFERGALELMNYIGYIVQQLRYYQSYNAAQQPNDIRRERVREVAMKLRNDDISAPPGRLSGFLTVKPAKGKEFGALLKRITFQRIYTVKEALRILYSAYDSVIPV